MSVASVCVNRLVFVQLTIVGLLLYPLVLLMLRRRNGPIGASVLPATLVPLFVGLGGAWLTLLNVMGGIAASGRHSILVVAAGVASALALVVYGGAISCLVSVTMCVFGLRTRADAGAPVARGARIAALATVALFIAVAGTFAFAVRAFLHVTTRLPIWPYAPLFEAGFAYAGALASFVWFVVAQRRPAAQLQLGRLAIAGACAIGCAMLTGAAWASMKMFASIAMFG
ncbi:MAG: hypothetical protein JO197_03275 [Acidobacteria bacterium]|nr:hypothetical protein [Acidobacteriota bacterium]MBV9476595.1 hypothetical protein [Acidobacteriota bacterium]